MRKAIDLLEAVVDLQLGNIDMDQWLQRLADQTGSDTAFTASWRAENTDLAIINSSDKLSPLPPRWLHAMDQIITIADPKQPQLLDDAARSAGLLEDTPDNLLSNPAWMIAFLDSNPARTVLGLRCPNRTIGWTKTDRNIFSKVLPVLKKAHLLHKKVVLIGNHLTIANQVLDRTPRGLISMTPSGEIMRTNTMANDILQQTDGIVNKDGRIEIRDEIIAQQFSEQLAKIRAMPPAKLADFVWNRNFTSGQSTRCYQLSMHAYRLEGWRLESHPYDRFVVMYLSAPDINTLPTTRQLGDFYGLTAAQARLVIALMEGKSSEEAAAHLHVSVNTIRSHLRAIYDKLGTDSKAGLIRIVTATLVDYSTRNGTVDK